MGPFNLWAVVGAVLLFALQQLATFLMKDWMERHKDQLKRALNLKLFMVGLDLFAISAVIWFAIALFNNSQPAARQDLLFVLGIQTMLIIIVLNLIDDIDRWVKAMRAKAAAAVATVEK